MATFEHSFLFLKLLALLGCGLMAGVFFAFSAFVMNALTKLQTAHAIAAMQSINITVINPLFMTVFMGTGVACIFISIASMLRWHQPNAVYLIIGSLLYLVGTLGVTIVFNVPLNEALAFVQPDSIDNVQAWTSYLRKWTFWNHIRTAAALTASASLAMALRY